MMPQHDDDGKAAHLPKADVDFAHNRRPAGPPPRPALYSLAVSLSAPPPPPPPTSSSTVAPTTSGPSPPPSILDPAHFPSLLGPSDFRSAVWPSQRPGASAPTGSALGIDEVDGSTTPTTTDPQPESAALTAHPGQQGPIQVDWLDLPRHNSSGSAGVSGTATARAPSPPPPTTTTGGRLHLPLGSVHLYRHAPAAENHNALAGVAAVDGGSSTSSSIYTTAEVKLETEEAGGGLGLSSTLIAVLAVPSYFSPADFLKYVQALEPEIECLRMIRDLSPSRSIVLIQLRSAAAAKEFVLEFNGKPFNAFEPERCHVVPIKHVLTHFAQPTTDPFATLKVDSSAASATAPAAEPVESRPFPIVLDSERKSLAMTDSRLEEAFELPTCPVCLERMDSAVTGLVTVPCLHTYHCSCLRKWGDSRCPVCRYSSKPLHLPPAPGSAHQLATAAGGAHASAAEASAPSSCSACATTESLWICLICGHVGCGRYSDGKHAQAHYASSGHLFALEIDTQRCWNYAADEYVHRIVMIKGTGSLVELPSSSSSSTTPPSTPRFGGQPTDMPLEKLEAVALEYSHLLSSQLAEQRQYFAAHSESLEARIVQLERQLGQSSERERDRTRIARLEKDLRAEREMNAGLLTNLADWRRKVDGAEREKEALRHGLAEKDEELRDLMFYLEARDKIAAADRPADDAAAPASKTEMAAADGGGTGSSVLGELQGGTVVLPPSTPGPGEPPAAPTKKKKKKGKK